MRNNTFQEEQSEGILKKIQSSRIAEYDISPLFLNRWSPRSYADRGVEPNELFAVLEAAKWAPSAYNQQSWRFYLARRPEDRQTFLSFIMESNRVWCEKAPVLVLLLSRKVNDKGDPHPLHAFEAGTAWGYMALEATRRGLIAHAMSGFDPDKARSVLHIPDDYDIQCVIAIGYQGDKEALPEKLQEREKPSDRRLLSLSVIEGEMRP